MPARTRPIRHRGRGWTVESAEPDGWITMSGAEACAVVSGAQTLDRRLQRRVANGAETARAGLGRCRRALR